LPLTPTSSLFCLKHTATTDIYTLSLHDALPIYTSAHERIAAAIEESHQVIWILNNDLQSFHKTKVLIDRMDDVFGKEHHIDEKVDRKSTRLNSSHVKISYAVFCLKKKKKEKKII